MALRTVGVRLTAEVAGYMANLKAAAKGTRDFTGELDRAARAGKLDAVANSAAGMGVALGAAFGAVALSAAKFDKQMSAVSAVTDASAKEMEQLRTAALEAGKATSFSATEAAKAQEELAKAGLSTSQILGGALSGALSLAAAGTIDLAEAADIAAKTMNVFNLEGKDVGHIADVLAASANKSATDVHEMGEALRMGGLAARNAGMSLEDTVGTLSAFADNALVGSDAGTSMKTMLQMLAAPTDKASSLMKELGIQTYDAQGNFIGAEKLAGVLQTRLGSLTQEQRNAALATIFGSDAMRAATVLYDLGAQGVKDYVTAVDDQGAAADVAAKKMDNLAGDIERLRGSLETLAIEAGSGSSSGLRTLVKAADELVGQFAAMPAAVSGGLTVLAGVSGVALLAFAGMVKVKGAVGSAVESLNNMGPAGTKAGAALQTTAKWAGRATAAFIALEVGAAVISAFIKDLNPQLEAATLGLMEWNREALLAGEAARIFGGDTEELNRALAAVAGSGFSQTIDKITASLPGLGGSVQAAKERVGAFDQALAQLARGGHAEQAGLIVEEMARRSKVSVEDVLKVLPTYTGALETAGKEAETAADAQSKVDKTAKDMTASWQGAIDAGKTLTDLFDQLNGAAINWAQAESALEAAIDDAATAIGKKREGIDAETEAGRRNRAALLDIVTATRDATQAKLDETGSVKEAKKVYDEGRAALIRSATQAGLTRKEAEKLADQWLKMPKVTTTTIATPGLDAANQKIRDLIERLKRLKELAGAGIHVDIRGPARATFRHGGVVEHARSGLLRDAAIYRPTEPAMYAFAEQATGGELFLPKRGDRERGRSILGVGADWYGMSVVPRNAMRWTGAISGGRTTAAPGPTAEQIGAAVAAYLGPLLGGDVVVAVDSVAIARATRQGERDLDRR